MFENCKSYQEAIRIVFGKNYITTQLKEKLIRYCKETLGVDICSVIEENKKPKILYCKNCGKELSGGQKLFCSHSCSATYNNKGTYRNKKYETHYCPNCGKEVKRGKGIYCSTECMNEYEYNEYIKKWKNGEVDGSKGKADISNHVRRYIFAKYGSKCQECGWDKKNPVTNKVPLEIHHINGDCHDNREENLQLLCPNCHSLTENYGNLNKNESGRRYKWGK